MNIDEAKKVLELEVALAPEEAAAKIEERFSLLHGLNAVSKESPGSPYLQARITIAKNVMLAEYAADQKEKGGVRGRASARSSACIVKVMRASEAKAFYLSH